MATDHSVVLTRELDAYRTITIELSEAQDQVERLKDERAARAGRVNLLRELIAVEQAEDEAQAAADAEAEGEGAKHPEAVSELPEEDEPESEPQAKKRGRPKKKADAEVAAEAALA